MSDQVESQDAATIIASAFPRCRGMEVELLTEGWDFRAFEVGGEWIFRFPKHEASARKLEMELALLPGLTLHKEGADPPAPRIPTYELRGTHPDSGWSFGGYRKLPGHAVDAAAGTDRQRVARQLGAFLGRLHGYPIDAARLACAPEMLDPLDYWQNRALGELDTLSLDRTEAEDVRRFLECQRPAAFDGEMVLNHNDLFSDHILVDPSGDISAIIDWSDAVVSDPALDFAALSQWLGSNGVEQALASYSRPIDDHVLARSRYIATCLGVRNLVQGAIAGRPDWTRVGLATLRHVLGGNWSQMS